LGLGRDLIDPPAQPILVLGKFGKARCGGGVIVGGPGRECVDPGPLRLKRFSGCTPGLATRAP
jgi:hypothetical protein